MLRVHARARWLCCVRPPPSRTHLAAVVRRSHCPLVKPAQDACVEAAAHANLGFLPCLRATVGAWSFFALCVIMLWPAHATRCRRRCFARVSTCETTSSRAFASHMHVDSIHAGVVVAAAPCVWRPCRSISGRRVWPDSHTPSLGCNVRTLAPLTEERRVMPRARRRVEPCVPRCAAMCGLKAKRSAYHLLNTRMLTSNDGLARVPWSLGNCMTAKRHGVGQRGHGAVEHRCRVARVLLLIIACGHCC